ncbi:MAG: hypothetical protein ACMXX9_04475 [Candidatus Woesearchaeota archaeon]
MKKQEIQDYLEKGYIRVKILFEVVGNPKEHIAKTIVMLKEQVEKEDSVIMLDSEIGEPEEAGDGLFGAFCDAELLVKNFYRLSYLAFNYMPASIDIIAPSKFEFKEADMTNFFGDMLALLHETNARHVDANSKAMASKRNFNALLQNSVVYMLSDKELDANTIGEPLGLKTEYITPYLEDMVKIGLLKKDNNKYSRAK